MLGPDERTERALLMLLDQHEIEPAVYHAAKAFAKLALFLNHGYAQLSYHGPKSVVFSWRTGVNDAKYATVSEAGVSLLESNRLGITYRDDLGLVVNKYHKWPGEPPHCMSCSCGMTDEQKRTVPESDHLPFHHALVSIAYDDMTIESARELAHRTLSRTDDKTPPSTG